MTSCLRTPGLSLATALMPPASHPESPDRSRSLTPAAIVIVAVLAATIWFALLGYRDLFEPDEGRYSEISREMVASGDWTTPRLNGFKYFEKPVLQYWATAISLELFGEGNASARLWTALIGFLGALWTGFVGWRLFGEKPGLYAFLMTVSSLLYVATGHIVTLDMTVSVFMIMGIGSLAIAQSQRANPTLERNWMLVGWAALALAMLSKGLIGLVLPGMGVTLYMLWQRDWSLLRHLHLGKGLLLFLLIAAPWFVAVSLANPEFPHFFFIHEHLQRYTTTIHERVQPFWYFVPVFIAGTLPWIVTMAASVLRPGFSWRPAASAGFETERFLWVFVVSVFVFFSLGQSKIGTYILPIIPVTALLAGKRLAERGCLRADAWIAIAFGALLLAAAWQVERFASKSIPADLYLAYRPWAVAAGVLAIAGGATLLKARSGRPLYFMAHALAGLLTFQCLLWGAQSLAGSRSSRELAQAIQAAVPADTDIYIVESYHPHSLPFYLGRTVTLVAWTGEMELGMEQEPQRWIRSPEEFARRWQLAQQAVAVFDNSVFEKYRKRDFPMRVIYQGARRTAVTRQ
jgi:4-amino-4-deoxy-L-arabinose transferase-like glycosyltransferase